MLCGCFSFWWAGGLDAGAMRRDETTASSGDAVAPPIAGCRRHGKGTGHVDPCASVYWQRLLDASPSPAMFERLGAPWFEQPKGPVARTVTACAAPKLESPAKAAVDRSAEWASLNDQISGLISQVSELYADPALEARFWNWWRRTAEAEELCSEAPSGVKKVLEGLRRLNLDRLGRFYSVESDYYDWPLQKRALRLAAPSQAHLCKSIVFENTRHLPTGDLLDPSNSKYYCVIVQYVDKLNTQKLMNFVRDLKQKTVSKKNYNLRVAPEDISLELTGYENNAVSPFGMQANLPIIVTESILSLEPALMYLGAGHIDWKVAIPVQSFIQATSALIADIST
ncbi:YbaK/aminoacyl-tRNA synthetase-associated domain-containing protein [Polychytrium aggregatum]|uniref:YbaK/aminoacyl-tRNA synthetase-associated domain-containing protein n=1 Tax=Polychytrium aggregatum TaxID=110093 RepID=UPI0022FED89C|nr:YbaK/aminoacyl-tRNA synthetase-associated domain-containing protein [Polychytrium aggregatum]KAI9205004.1 YbaK/aminoacyl-tRNA synthetase-associated domain-containing protein [Polychytrium aggregatum]